MKLQLADVSGRSIQYTLSGVGTPSVVLLSGHRSPLDNWNRIYEGLSESHTVLAYDRLGTGGSDRPSSVQDGETVVATLLELLGVLAIEPPYVLVAHSLGGLYANLFARHYPDKTAGVVLIESGHPDEALHREKTSGVLGTAIEKVLSLLSKSSFKSDPYSEYNGVAATVRQLKGAPGFPDLPAAVVTGTRRMPLVPKKLFQEHLIYQNSLSELTPNLKTILCREKWALPTSDRAQLSSTVDRARRR